jgi:hypothetical protein
LLQRQSGLSESAVRDRATSEIAAVAGVLPLFTQWPMRPSHWGSRWRNHDYNRALASMTPIVRAVVWELWRDYHEWPGWRDVACRLMTWLDIDFQEGSWLAGDFGRHTDRGNTGLIVEHPYHLRPPNRTRSDSARHLWRTASFEDMVHQERLYQWRIVLGEDGLRYRTPVTILLDDLRDMNVSC